MPLPRTKISDNCTGLEYLLLAAKFREAQMVGTFSQPPTANERILFPEPCPHVSNACYSVPVPQNQSELELFKLLDDANLLTYFATFLAYGGDDVNQISNADEEEFMEIMTLIGMIHRPLHVRRFQKALMKWRQVNNMQFETDDVSSNDAEEENDDEEMEDNEDEEEDEDEDQDIDIEEDDIDIEIEDEDEGNEAQVVSTGIERPATPQQEDEEQW